jgi:hypothetical protein
LPGPGTYTYSNMNICTDAFKYTLKSRTKNGFGKRVSSFSYLLEPFEMARKVQTPGPGHYPSIGINPVGKYSVSNIP